ncbi:MAG TPA: hypothetical protein V6C72_05210, partial [Chroococcales cyanobacterium]
MSPLRKKSTPKSPAHRKAAKSTTEITQGEYVGVIQTLKGLMVEVQIVGERPEEKELLTIEGHPEVFLEINFFRAETAV